MNYSLIVLKHGYKSAGLLVDGETVDSGLTVIATHLCTKTDDLYTLVDFLNRNLKDKDVVFGLANSKQTAEKMVITLYRTSESL